MNLLGKRLRLSISFRNCILVRIRASISSYLWSFWKFRKSTVMRYKAIYDSQGLAYEFENGEMTYVRSDLTGAQDCTNQMSFPTVYGDLPAFVSPIDGSLVSGRAALREHCLRHNVVPTADLDGLPAKSLNQQVQFTQ